MHIKVSVARMVYFGAPVSDPARFSWLAEPAGVGDRRFGEAGAPLGLGD